MKYLVAISIGPVQDFIAAARRCRDLWCGSQLLSELSKAGAKALFDRGATLIFPSPSNPATDLEEASGFTVANKLLASLDTDDVPACIENVRLAIQQRLNRAADLQAMKLHGLVVKNRIYWDQLESFVEFYAAWVPHGEYRQSRARLEALLAARKTLRTFQPYEGGEGEPKSSLDGAREHVIQLRSKTLYESNLKDNEYLDAIGILKRFGGRSPRFDSTVDVAALPFVQGIRQSANVKLRESFREYERFVRDNGLPPDTYSLLYEHESRQIFEKGEASRDDLAAIRKALGEPNPPYFAMLLGDGDRMGRAISSLDAAAAHQSFSRSLSTFAQEAKRLIDGPRHNGCSIYCGGDDVLALLPLHTALECAYEVRTLFQQCMERYNVSFSAGLAVAHGLEPLTDVRNWSAEAERTAKSAGGRNALCISVHPRSGAPTTVCGKWDELCPLLREVVQLRNAPDEEGIPRRFGYEIRGLLDRTESWVEVDSALPQLVRAVAKKKDCGENARALIARETTDRTSIERFCRALMVSGWFARAEREANGDFTNNPD
jgi:CRISPR-associated protein Cmr2